MLIEMPAEYRRPDPIFALIASINGNEPQTSEERVGIYRIGHFGSSDFLRGWERYPEFDPIPVRDDMPEKMKEDAWDGTVGRNAYGVCDSLEQLLAHFPELEAPGREFVATIVTRPDSAPPTRLEIPALPPEELEPAAACGRPDDALAGLEVRAR